jgi:ADP-ribose pyrophosphatase
MAFDLLESKTIYRGKVFDLRQDTIRLPNGNRARLDIVDHPPAVTILPVDSEGNIWFIRQYRHSAGGVVLELPAGVMEANEDPSVSAQREIREEIGMAADEIRKLGEFWLAPGYSSEYMYLFLAQGLHPAPLEADVDEFIIVEKIPMAQAFSLAENGGISDAKSLAALLIARPHLRA